MMMLWPSSPVTVANSCTLRHRTLPLRKSRHDHSATRMLLETKMTKPAVGIPEEFYKTLFLRKHEILSRLRDETQDKLVSQPLESFIVGLFPEAHQTRETIFRTGRVSHENLWLIFEPREILYEEHLIPPSDVTYAQCVRLVSLKDVRSSFDGIEALQLTVEDFAYTPEETRPGRRLVSFTSTRQIRKYAGVKRMTVEDLGLIPYRMMSTYEQEVVESKLCKRSLEYFRLCTIPFSVWTYTGPISLARPFSGVNSPEETAQLRSERLSRVRVHPHQSKPRSSALY